MNGWEDGASGAPHIIGAVQRFGLLSAASVVDRYIEIIDRGPLGDPFRRAPEAVDSGAGSLDRAVRMLEAWRQALETAARLIPDALDQGTESLVLSPTRAGRACEASMWIHNRTSTLVATIALHSTNLVSPEELSLAGDAVTFRPEGMIVVEPGTCQEVIVRVSVPPGQSPGEYHGLVVGSGAPDGVIAIHVEVEGEGVSDDGPRT